MYRHSSGHNRVAATQRGAEVVIAQVLRHLGARCTRPCMQGTASRRRTWVGVRLMAENPEEGQSNGRGGAATAPVREESYRGAAGPASAAAPSPKTVGE